MHPLFIRLIPAIGSPWEARSDWDIFTSLSKAVSDLAEKIDLDPMKEVVATPLLHDTPQELAQPLGKIKIGAKVSVNQYQVKRCRKFMLSKGIIKRFMTK